jgi:hypothetical protein
MKPLYALLTSLSLLFVGIMLTALRFATWPQEHMYFLSEDERISVALGGGLLFFMWVVILIAIFYCVNKAIDYKR